MAYSTHYTRSTKDHRIANVYDFKCTISDYNGHKKTIKKKLTIPWEYYSGNSSCNSKTILNNMIFCTVLHLGIANFGKDNVDMNNSSYSYTLLDRVDQTPKMMDDFEKFAYYGKYLQELCK